MLADPWENERQLVSAQRDFWSSDLSSENLGKNKDFGRTSDNRHRGNDYPFAGTCFSQFGTSQSRNEHRQEYEKGRRYSHGWLAERLSTSPDVSNWKRMPEIEYSA